MKGGAGQSCREGKGCARSLSSSILSSNEQQASCLERLQQDKSATSNPKTVFHGIDRQCWVTECGGNLELPTCTFPCELEKSYSGSGD